MADSTLRGRIVWYELMTTDMRGAEAFYPAITGWTPAPFAGTDMPYTVWTRGDAQIGGLMTLPEQAKQAGAPPHWMIYIGTPNVDETASAAARLGARLIVPPQDIPSVGRFSVLADPHGAVFAIYTSASPSRPEAPPELGDFSWHELATTNNQSAFNFYRELFGWEETGTMDMGPMGIYRMFGRGGRPMGGIFDKPAEMPAPPHWLVYARVADVHRAADAVKAGCGKVLNGPMEVPGGDWIVQCCDPQGAAFALHQVKA